MKSSDIKQKESHKRLGVYERDLPVLADFGDELPYPVILTNWDDPISGVQYVTSTCSDIGEVKHWIGVGVNKDDGTFFIWQPDGTYKEVMLKDASQPETNTTVLTGTLPSDGTTTTLNHGIDATTIVNVNLMVEISPDQWINPVYSTLNKLIIDIVNVANTTLITVPLTSTLLGLNFKLLIISL